MIQFIVGITLIALLIEYPGILFTALIVILAAYIYAKRPDLFEFLTGKLAVNTDTGKESDDLSAGKKNFTTYQDRMDRAEEDLKAKMKPGAEKDPEIKQMQKNVQEEMGRNSIIAEKELKLDLLKEAEKEALAGNWNKVESIEREIRRMETKSEN